MEFAGVCLITKNVPVLVDFYSKILGVEAEGNDTHAEIKIEGLNLAIFSEEGMENMAPGSMTGTGCGSLTINIKVEEVDEEYNRLKSLGVEFVKLPESYPWGSRSFWFKDPDGNVINFFSLVHT